MSGHQNGIEKRVLGNESAQADELRSEAAPDWAADRRAPVQAEVDRVARVLFVDKGAVVDLTRFHHSDVMPRTEMVIWEPGFTIGDPPLLEILRAGREVVAWFSRKADLNSYGSELRRRMKPWLPEGQSLRFIQEVASEEWDGVVPSFDDLWRTAPSTLPRKLRGTSKRTSNTADAAFDTSPAEIARRIVRRFGAELLVVAPPKHAPAEYSTGYALSGTGLWLAGGDPWAGWLRKIAEDMTYDAAVSGLADKALMHAVASINRVKSTSMVERVRQHLRAELDDLRNSGEPHPEVTECAAEDLDVNTRFIGARNGVVDLHTGRLLSPEEGRACLVTRSVPVDFDPDAKHEAVDRLFRHLGPDESTWWWQVLGRGLRGPTKRLYAAVGEPNGGKSTLLNAMMLTLGPYARKAARGVLSASNRASETQLTPGLLAWLPPTRFVFSEEEKRRQILDAGLVKDLTGMGFLAARGMRQNLREGRVTATTIMFCNRDSVPRLSMETEGMQDRYRELAYPRVPVIDLSMSETTVASPKFQEAFFARLVWWAAHTPAPPDDIPSVAKATVERIREDIGEIGAFASRIVRGGNVLTLDEVWTAWLQFVGAPDGATEAAGIKRLRFSKTLRDYVTDLPAAKIVTKDSRKVRGWRVWKLLTLGEMELYERTRDSPVRNAAESIIRDLLAEMIPTDTADDKREKLQQRLREGIIKPEAFEALDRSIGQGANRIIDGLESLLGALLVNQTKAMKDAGFSDRQTTLVTRYRTLSLVVAIGMAAKIPKSPAFEQVKDRFISCQNLTLDREFVALEYLVRADRSLEAKATIDCLMHEAVRLLVDDASEAHRKNFNLPFAVDDMESAIKELCGAG